jgi:hypothetical protein
MLGYWLQHLTFFLLLACAEIVPAIGNPLNERSPGFPPLGSFLDYNGEKRFGRVMPRDRARTAAAFWFGDVAVLFVFFHELGHVFGGHVDYLRDRAGRLVLAEF